MIGVIKESKFWILVKIDTLLSFHTGSYALMLFMASSFLRLTSSLVLRSEPT